MSRVLIADDHAVVRAGFRHFLSAQNEVVEIGEAGSAAELFEKLRSKAWDLLLLDIHLKDRVGLSLLPEVRIEFPHTRVLIVSGLPEDQYATEVLRAGAAGFLSKDTAPNELVVAVRKVLSGQRYVSSRVAEQMVSELGRPTTPRHEQLSLRERQVFDQLAIGKTVTTISVNLALSIKTVSTYRARILEKMSFKSNADITSHAIRYGLQ